MRELDYTSGDETNNTTQIEKILIVYVLITAISMDKAQTLKNCYVVKVHRERSSQRSINKFHKGGLGW
jgi:hypothetical protein